jgi:two-component system NarL family sensor kinase
MRTNLQILCFSLLMTFSAAGQLSTKDSLLNQVKLAKEDTLAVKLYLDIGAQYEETEPAKAKEYYKKALTLSTKLNFNTGTYKSLTNYGSMFYVTSEYDSLLVYAEKALAISRKINDSLNIGLALINVGTAYGFASNFEAAVQYNLEGLKVVEGKANNKVEVQINDKLQVLYLEMGQFDKGIHYGKKALQQARRLKMPSLTAQILANLALNYSSAGRNDKAKPLLVEALAIAEENGNKFYESGILMILTDLLMETHDYETAKRYAEKSLLLAREVASSDAESKALRALAIYYLLKKDFTRATKFAEEALVICEKNDFKIELSTVHRVISYIAVATGDMESGYKYYLRSDSLYTDIVKSIVSTKSASLEKKYETEKKESKIKQLEAEKKVQQLSIRQKNTLNYLLTGGALAVLIIALLFFRNHKNKQKLQQQRITELETEKHLTATQAVLKGEEQERTRLAKDLHDGLGGMLSGIKYSLNTMKENLIMTPDNAQAFERSMDMLDSSIKEMRRVAHNMMPEALVKFGLDTALKDFSNDINKSGALQVSYQAIGIETADIAQITAITVYRIVQELLNNIMKHAAARTAIVQVTKSNGQLTITVEDDGIGFDAEVLTQSKGMGWANIQSRVDYLKGRLDVQSGPGKGTSVHIELNA